jgi:hypothetical protein
MLAVVTTVMSQLFERKPNKAGAGKAGIAPLFAIEHHGSGLPDQRRSATP